MRGLPIIQLESTFCSRFCLSWVINLKVYLYYLQRIVAVVMYSTCQSGGSVRRWILLGHGGASFRFYRLARSVGSTTSVCRAITLPRLSLDKVGQGMRRSRSERTRLRMPRHRIQPGDISNLRSFATLRYR